MSLHLIGGGQLSVSEGSVLSWIESAAHAEAPAMRLDTRESPETLTAARSSARAWARQIAQMAPAERRDEVTAGLLSAVGRGLGWRSDDGAVRCDSWYGPQALTTQADLVRPVYAARRLSELIPRRSVEQWARYVPTGALGHTGSVAVHRPGVANVPVAGVEYNERQQQVHTFVTSTQIDWMDIIQAPRASFSVVAEQAEAVRQVMATYLEDALVAGVAGIDFQGVAQIGVPRYHSGVDYSSGSTTLDQIYRDLVAIVQAPERAAGFRGDPPNVLLIGSRWYQSIQRASAFSLGSGATGADILMMLQSRGAGLSGIEQIIKVPSLSRWGGSATVDAAMTIDTRNNLSLRQIEAMAPAPVRTASTLTSDLQLWAMRHGGLDVASTLPIVVATATVA